ncbi:unnamed protein product [Clonostachys rosea f. rosea IK726]|uniref:Uncharacterized protein n=1 Tax=Clonostachys rosea f. rosea IK726 TaxID=1349383 RepID=A0ACA9TL39_BIOOC|nr:unnamed protein product [Clonostachys rosea f. rosea IK726]
MACSTSQNRPLSINQILRQNPRDQLYVEPLKWTHEHLRHLEISFVEPKELHAFDPVHRESKLWDTINFTSPDELLSQDVRLKAVEDFLQKADNALSFEDDLYLFFHKKQQKLDCTFSLEPGDDIPLAAFLDYMTIVTKREGTVEPRLKPQSTNTSIEISKKKSVLKLKKITPENPLYDPFVAAILIALAQAQQRATASSRPHGKGKEAVDPEDLKPLATDERKYDVRLLVTFQKDATCILYKSVISSAFLAKFNDLDYAPPTSTPMRIELSDIPFKPRLSLHRRMFNELFPERQGTGGDSDERSSNSEASPTDETSGSTENRTSESISSESQFAVIGGTVANEST